MGTRYLKRLAEVSRFPSFGRSTGQLHSFSITELSAEQWQRVVRHSGEKAALTFRWNMQFERLESVCRANIGEIFVVGVEVEGGRQNAHHYEPRLKERAEGGLGKERKWTKDLRLLAFRQSFLSGFYGMDYCLIHHSSSNKRLESLKDG